MFPPTGSRSPGTRSFSALRSATAAFVGDFRDYYGPTMNAFAAAEKNGRAAELQRELEALFERQNTSEVKGTTTMAATFLRVTVTV